MAKITEYIQRVREEGYPALFDENCLGMFGMIEEEFGALDSDEVIEEVVLGEERRTCDFSIRIDRQDKRIKEVWYEMDYEGCTEGKLRPSFFVDASAVKPGAVKETANGESQDEVPDESQDESQVKIQDEILNEIIAMLEKYAGSPVNTAFLPMLRKCVDALQGKCKQLFQLGIMSGREAAGNGGQRETVAAIEHIRIFTEDLTPQDFIEYLRDLGWRGDLDALGIYLERLRPYSDGEKFILDFDVSQDGISEIIGINFGTKKKDADTVQEWLTFLEGEGMCRCGKKEEVMRWVREYPFHSPFIQNDVSHYKIPFQGDKPLKAKAYLRQGTKSFGGFRAYARPVLMNLELTTKCPLHCPQCYCDLNTGQELPFEKAVYWIQNAAKNHVSIVNLSGGETLCYKRLPELVVLCAKLGMKANIAISGSYFHAACYRELVDAGIGDICVSLNGSTEEVNRKSRDGYAFAIQALELLRREKFPNTCINWVMHASNADDFEEMIALAERYEVKELVVMVFKPDAAHQLADVPDREQMLKVAAAIKNYRKQEGRRLSIEAEECFSQMRALLGERFLINLNRGVEKGCGAGRDGVSVNVEGKLTPCRHLAPKPYCFPCW